MNTEENTPEKDQLIRQKMADFCPDTSWQPSMTWEKISKKIQEEPKSKKVIVLSFSTKKLLQVAAVFLLLVGVAAAIWLQIAPQNTVLDYESILNGSQKKQDEQKIYLEKQKNKNSTEALPKEKIDKNDPKQSKEILGKETRQIQKIATINQKKKALTEVQNLEIKEISEPSIEQILVQKVSNHTQNETTTSIQDTQNTAKKQIPQIVLQVDESAQNNKLGIRIGKRKDKATQETTAGNTKNQKSIIRIQSQPNKGEIKPQETQMEIALLKVKLN